MEAANQAFLDACLAIFNGQPAQGIDSSSPTFETALADADAETFFDAEAEQILGDLLKVEFPKDLFKAADAKFGEAEPLKEIKNELESAGHDLDYDFKFEDHLPRIIEYLVARHGLDRNPLETEAAGLLGLPDPHAGAGQQPAPPPGIPPVVPPSGGVQPPAGPTPPAQPQLIGALPGAATQPPQAIGLASGQGTGNQPAKKPPVPPGTPSAKSLFDRLRPVRQPAPDTGTLRADPAWLRQWVLGLTEYYQGREGMLKSRIAKIRHGEVEPKCSNFVRIQILRDLSSILTGNIDPDLYSNNPTP